MRFNKLNVKTDWWESLGGFFGKSYLEADNSFEGFLNTPKVMDERIKEEIEGVIKLCRMKKGYFVLDAPCGYGRHSIGLAQKQMSVIGVDINDYELSFANKKAADLKLQNCKFLKKDLRKIAFKNKFNTVINMFYSFGFFEGEDDDFEVVKKYYKSLRKGGKFLMHTFITVPKIISGNYKKHEIRNLTSGNKLELFRDYDFVTKREYGDWSIIKRDGSRQKMAPYSMRIYTDLEFIGLCIKAGFKRVDVYGDWKGTLYSDGSELMIVVATK